MNFQLWIYAIYKDFNEEGSTGNAQNKRKAKFLL